MTLWSKCTALDQSEYGKTYKLKWVVARQVDFSFSSSKWLTTTASQSGVLGVWHLVGAIIMTSKTSVGALVGAIAGASLALLFDGLGTSARADSIPYPNPGTINPATYSFTAAFTGDVIAYFARNSASFENTLGLQINGVSTGIFGLDNLTSHVGDSVNLGFAHAGDTLTFVMHNIVPGNGDLFSDPALNGPYDGLAVGTQHIYSTPYTATSPIFGSIPVGAFVSFEDLPFRNSNFNYDDLDFVFTNVTAAETPVPAALPLFASGLGALGLFGWRRNRRRAARC